ncbi:hypothetical protein RRG08_034650 [Elysia crispata]|uniref:Uncharacterized protein n=1 Tax=Elysia crispata TaxID=231223 RepID=A0AAE1B2C0_9GAST|nr:hypothetical protein RRG08_034650 [Elysia crispata]
MVSPKQDSAALPTIPCHKLRSSMRSQQNFWERRDCSSPVGEAEKLAVPGLMMVFLLNKAKGCGFGRPILTGKDYKCNPDKEEDYDGIGL